MCSLRDGESHPHRGESTHPLSSPTCSEVGESHGFCVEQLLPYSLAFAAGAMGFLVFTELIPEGLEGGDRQRIGTIIASGFVLMMALHLLDKVYKAHA